MKRFSLAIIGFLFAAIGARAQSGFTQAHAIVVDPSGTPYANCSGNVSFVPSPSATQVPTIGGSTFPTSVVIASCDSFGAFSVKLADNNFVVDGHTSPPASQWQFNINAQGGTPGFVCKITITGPSQDVSVPLQACAAPLPAQGGGNSFAFAVTPQSATPSFTSNQDTAFAFLLNQSVTSSTFITNAKPGLSPVYYINPCQDAVGGWNMVWPANVLLPANYVFSKNPGQCSPVAFVYNPNTAKWTPWINLTTGGGGGTTVSLQTNSVVNGLQTVLNLIQGSGISLTADGSGGVTIVNTSTANTVSTSLTNNKLPKANGANSVVDSSITDNGSTVSTAEAFSAAAISGTSLQASGISGSTQCVHVDTTGLLSGTGVDCSGSPPASPDGAIQKKGAGNSFAASNLTETGTVLSVDDTTNTKGPNPEVDVARFGARPFPINSGAPAVPGITTNCVNGNTLLSLSGPGGAIGLFQNGDGIALPACGAVHAMATPAAPTVTPSVAIAPTNTGFVATNGSAGAVTDRCYVIVARNTLQGKTAASPETCISGGSTILGSDPISVTSCSRSSQTVTCITSAHTLPVGCSLGTCGSVLINGTSDDANFGGWFPLSSSADTTHFTYVGGLSSLTGATTSSTGGTFTYYNSDHLVVPAYSAGMWQYGIYEGATGAETFVGVALPNVPSIQGQATARDWDYYGSTYSGNVVRPPYWPSTPPSVAIPNTFTTTIASGGGTASLTLAAAPTTSSTGSSALFDNCPTVSAANAFANNFTGGGGMTAFNPVQNVPGVGLAYIFNTYCSLTGTVSQSMPINLVDTMQFSGQWYGNLNPNSLYISPSSFSLQGHVAFNINGANPGIFMQGQSMQGVKIAPAGNDYIGILHVNSVTSYFRDMEFSSSSANDYNGVMFYDFPPTAVGFGWKMENVSMVSGPNSTSGSSFTPLLISKFNGEIHFDNIPMAHRGLFFAPRSDGIFTTINQREETQGLTMPFASFYGGTGGVGGSVEIYNTILDTAAQPLVSNFTGGFGTLGAVFTIDGTNSPSSGMPLVSGTPLPSLIVRNTTASILQVGQNVNMRLEGANSQQNFNTNLILGPLYGLYSDQVIPAAPTCTTTTAGPPFTQVFTASTFTYAPVYSNGGVGTFSAPSNSCTANGTTQQVTVTIPAALTGAIGYVFWKGTAQFSVSPTNCATPGSNTLVTLMGQNCGVSLPRFHTGGPAGVENTQAWSDTYNLTHYMDITGITAPANPAAGQFRTYVDTGTGKWACKDSSGANCGPAPTAVTSLSGDGALITNSGSTGPTTLTLGAAGAFNLWFNNTAGSAIPTYVALSSLPTAQFPTLNQNTTGTAANLTGCGGASAGDICVFDTGTWTKLAGNTSGTQVLTENASGIASWGSGATTAFQANGTPLTASATVNFQNSNATNGLTLTFSNPSAGNVKLGYTGTLDNTGLTNTATTVNSQTCTLGSTCTIPFQTNTVNNTSQAGINLIPSTVNATGITVTPTNSATNQVKFEETGKVNTTSGGTNQDFSASTGVVQVAAGVFSTSTGLANGTAGTTQACSDTTTKVATDQFAFNCYMPIVMTTIGDMVGGGTSGVTTRIVGGKTGQTIVATNAATPSFASSGVAEGNAGSAVTSTPYVVLCDSATAIRDRLTVIRIQTGGSVVTNPDHTATGCGNNFVYTIFADGVGVTVNRSGSDTFSVFDGSTATDGATSFTLLTGQYATINNGTAGIWEVRKTPSSVGTVTSIATTSPITGGTITTTGTIGCATCVTSSSPGAGIAHFAGSTQAATSSAVVGSDMANNTVTATQLAAQYSKGSCTELWGGSGTSFALTSGDDAISNNSCYNDSGVTRTITAVKCRSSIASNTTTVNPTFGSAGTGTTILSGALTCGSSLAYSSSGTVSNASWTTGTGINPAMGGTLTGTSIAMIVEYTY